MRSLKDIQNRKSTTYADTANHALVQEKEALTQKMAEGRFKLDPNAEELARTMADLAKIDEETAAQSTIQEQPAVQVQPITQEQPVVQEEVDVGKQPAAKKETTAKSKSSATQVADFVDGEVVFHEKFSTSHIKRADCGSLNYPVPRSLIKAAKLRAVDEGTTLVEVQNILLAMYIESGIPPAILKRYKKAIKKD